MNGLGSEEHTLEKIEGFDNLGYIITIIANVESRLLYIRKEYGTCDRLRPDKAKEILGDKLKDKKYEVYDEEQNHWVKW